MISLKWETSNNDESDNLDDSEFVFRTEAWHRFCIDEFIAKSILHASICFMEDFGYSQLNYANKKWHEWCVASDEEKKSIDILSWVVDRHNYTIIAACIKICNNNDYDHDCDAYNKAIETIFAYRHSLWF